jgi:PAS domain S-box-containing protein
MTIRRKMLGIVAITAMGFIVLVAASAVVLQRVQSQLTTIENHFLPKVELEPSLDAQLERISRGFQDAVGAHDSDALEATHAEKIKFEQLLDGAHDAVDATDAAKLHEALDAYYDSARDVSLRLMRGESDDASGDAIAAMQSNQARVAAQIKATASLDRAQLHGAFASAGSAMSSAALLCLLVGLSCVALVIAIGLVLTRDILRSFDRLTAGFARFGAGEFAEPIAIVGKDELADVAGNANTMAARLERLYRSQQHAEKRFRDLMESAPDALVIMEEDGSIVLVNAMTEKLFGYSREELVGKSADMLLPERHRGKRVLREKSEEDEELRGRRKNGNEIPIEIARGPVETEDGLLVSSAIRDVTERKRIEAQLQVSNQELEAFSYSVAHDLRSPLRGINGFSRALLEDWGDKLDEDARQQLDRICAAAGRMGSLIDALLSLARVTRAQITRKELDMSQIADGVVQQLRVGQTERAVDVVIQPGVRAYGDPALVAAVLENLLGNAWKFTANKSPARIEFGAERSGATTAFFVRDDGAGFDMAYAEKLFAPFQRLHTVREFAGTGIGLATVSRIVRRHGGRIWAEGAVNAGATFRFTLGDATSPDSK